MKSYVMTLTVFCVVVFGLGGCTSMTPRSLNIYHDTNRKQGITDIRNPQLNVVTTAEIGSNMYEKARLHLLDTYDASINQTIHLQSGFSGLFQSSERNLGTLLVDSQNNWKAACTSSITGYTYCLFDTDNNNNFDKFGALINSLYDDITEPISYTLIPQKPIYKEDSFKYIVLYQGKKDNVIKLSFREFINEMARPAFTQDIEYQLDKNGETIIGFKGLRIKVIKATNTDITYSVIQDYN